MADVVAVAVFISVSSVFSVVKEKAVAVAVAIVVYLIVGRSVLVVGC
ncbi:MAG: hypothetical protein ISS69_02830 [Phycisphaerae bacterium]|nr:hypothetical protein [Planctomycetota bacterium]MBL7219023.1 hypothetical protein [Phycisphaerae bacterium]